MPVVGETRLPARPEKAPVVTAGEPVKTHSRVCPECGSDRWAARDYDRVLNEAQRLRRDADELARQNGLLTYQLRIAVADEAERTAGLRRKIIRQSRAITRLERRLRGLGKQPWEGSVTPFAAVPGADMDGEVHPHG